MRRVIAMLLALMIAAPLAAGAQRPDRPGGAGKGWKGEPMPERRQGMGREGMQENRRLSQEERQQLHRDLDRADQEIYRRRGGR